MRNPAIAELDVLVGTWDLSLMNAWFLEPADVQGRGRATVRWLGEAFIEMEATIDAVPTWHVVIGRSAETPFY